MKGGGVRFPAAEYGYNKKDYSSAGGLFGP
jgi:hypothetical protein